MSRIGKAPIVLPSGVEFRKEGDVVVVKGKLGELRQTIHPAIQIELENGQVVLSRPNDEKQNRAMHGLYRSLISNMVKGVSEGWKEQLELVGVGYRAAAAGQTLDLSLGFSHNIMIQLPSEVKVEAAMEKGKNPVVTLTSFDKQLLGMVTAKIRSFRRPEPYKGKGVRFVGEQVRRKAGKSAGKK